MNIEEKAKLLLNLHHGDKMLILPNITTPLGARILADRDFGAVATPSAGIAEQLGIADGENIPFDVLLYILKQIVDASDLPVSADIERGYASNIKQLEANIAKLLDIGVVGINVEDLVDDGLRPLEAQVERIIAMREVANKANIGLVINARTDIFAIDSDLTQNQKIDAAIIRAEAFKNAGADIFYPVMLKDGASIQTLVEQVALPINILASPDALPLLTLEKMGVKRVSLGPFLFRATAGCMIDIIDEMKQYGDYSIFSDRFHKDGLGKFLKG